MIIRATLVVGILMLAAMLAGTNPVEGARYAHEKWRLPWPDHTADTATYGVVGCGYNDSSPGCDHTGLNSYALDLGKPYPNADDNWPVVAAANGTVSSVVTDPQSVSGLAVNIQN